jgi:hypothetical protein
MLREQIENPKNPTLSPKGNNWVYWMHVVVFTDLAIVFVTYFGLGYWQGA